MLGADARLRWRIQPVAPDLNGCWEHESGIDDLTTWQTHGWYWVPALPHVFAALIYVQRCFLWMWWYEVVGMFGSVPASPQQIDAYIQTLKCDEMGCRTLGKMIAKFEFGDFHTRTMLSLCALLPYLSLTNVAAHVESLPVSRYVVTPTWFPNICLSGSQYLVRRGLAYNIGISTSTR